jgi:hypothetical protein
MVNFTSILISMQFVIRQCIVSVIISQKVSIGKQGLAPKQIGIVSQAIIIILYRIQYAISAWGRFVHSDRKRIIDVLLL